MKQQGYESKLKGFNRLSVVPEDAVIANCKIPRRSVSCNYGTRKQGVPATGIPSYNTLPKSQSQQTQNQRKTYHQPQTKDPDSSIDSVNTAAFQRVPVKKRRRYTLSDVQKSMLHHPQSSNETSDSEIAPSYGFSTLNRDSRVGAISQEEAERKRMIFLRYLEQRFPHQGNAIEIKSSHQESFLADTGSRSSYATDSLFYSSSGEYESSAGGSLHRGGKFRSSLPIVRTRSRSRESPLGVIYLEYCGESRAALLPNELTSLDTIRALFVQAYPGLLTMPMLNPQRHTLLLKNKKTGNLDEIENISRIKNRSTVRARPTGIPTPNSKKPPVLQKPKFDKSNQKRLEDRTVAEKNQKNQQKSGLKTPVKSLVRQHQNGSKTTDPSFISDANSAESEPKSNGTTQKSIKSKAPPPPPRSAKPKQFLGTPKPLLNSDGENLSSNGSLPVGVGLGGGSFPHKGFSYVPSGLTPKKEAKPLADSNLRLPSSLSTSAEPSTQLTSFRSSAETLNSDSGSSKSPPMQPRTYAGSSMASQTQFSSVPQDPNIPKLLKPKSYEHRSKVQGSKPTSPTSTAGSTSNDNLKMQQAVNERKGAPNSPQYGLSNRSFRGNQPKPFSIPVVPDVSNIRTNTESSSQLRERSVSEEPKKLSSPVSSQNSVKLASSDGSLEKNKPSNSKKGLFGFRKLGSSKNSSSAKQNAKRTQSVEKPQSNPTSVLNSADEVAPFPLPIHSDTPLRSSSFSDSTPPNDAPRVPKKSGAKSPNISGRKATIPKTDLLHSLLNPKSDPSEKMNERVTHSPSSSLYSDSDREASSGPPGLTGVLKNCNLVKSTSASSILTDSGASNLSATPSVKMKKVSFQDDVTVCDGNSISTFSNSLRHPEYDDRLHVGGVAGQSLSHDATEGERLARECAIVRPWQASMQPGTLVAEQPRMTPNPTGYMQYQSSAYTPSFTSFGTHQSAVAAAIETISAKSSMASQYKLTPSIAPVYSRYNQLGVSCASPVPHITRQDRVGSVQKENWIPPKRCADQGFIPQGVAHIQNRPFVISDSGSLQDSSSMVDKSYHSEMINENETTYLQTQNHPQKDPDTPPYYECCAPVPSSHQVTPTQLNEALGQSHGIKEQLPRGGSRNLPLSPITPRNVPSVAPKPEKSSYRMVTVERKLADTTGMVDRIMSEHHRSLTPSTGETPYTRLGGSGADVPFSNMVKVAPELTSELLKLRKTARNLREEIKDLQKQQRCNTESMNEMVSRKAKEIAQFIASTAGAEQRPLRSRRMRLDQQRHAYGKSASDTEKQLSDVEAGVEELRNEVVERRCRVNAREVEALVLQLSQAGRTIAQLKGSFPSLCEEIRTVGAAETEVIYAEEKFVEAEPPRLDEQLKRCKQLTATLFTLKKLANVQEARSKTPTSFSRATTPCPMTSVGDDPNLKKRMVLNDVKRLRVDHGHRMDSIQALEMAEKALNRTDYITQIDERQKAQLIELYNNRTTHETNLTASESSSIESLPPPPPPSDRINLEYSKLPSAYPYSVPNNAGRQAPMDLKIPRSTSGYGYGVISPDVGYMSSEQSPDVGRISLPPSNTGSLPRYAGSSAYRMGYSHQASGRSHPNLTRPSDGLYQGKPMERSRSVTPQHWHSTGLEVAPYQIDVNRAPQMTNEERQLIIEKQKTQFVEKNKKLKDQYSKLQQMQIRQRMSAMKPPASKLSPPGSYQHHQISLKSGAKSSDV